MPFNLQIQSETVIPPSVSSQVNEATFPTLRCNADQSDVDSMEDENDDDYQPSTSEYFQT